MSRRGRLRRRGGPSGAGSGQPAGTGEPLYTNSTQNTQWFEWPASQGADAYRVRYDYYENNALKAAPTSNAPSAGSGNSWANWSGVATLQHGGQYGVCAQGQYSFPNDSLFFPDGPNSCSMGTMLGRRAYTTIDRSKPAAAIALAAGADSVKDTKVALRIDFSDDVAGPFPANFLCFQVGGGPQSLCDQSGGSGGRQPPGGNSGAIYGHNPACSVPGSAGKSTTFSCTADYGQIPDGNVWACVIAADASIPDNPNGPDQSATAEKANLSAASCDGVVVDRTPPTVSIAVASSAVKVGELVSVQASASDATSGLAGAGQWTWGDNTAGASGDAVSHTYTQAGTYELALTVTDAAGNAATAKKTITVAAAGGGTTTPPPPAGGGTTTTPPATGGGTTTTPPATGGGTTTTPPAGGGGTGVGGAPDTGDDAPSIDLDAPRSARARARSIPVGLTANDAGRVQLTLARGERTIARASVRLDADGTADYRLKLPKGTKAGRYTLKATYAASRGRSITVSRSVTLTGKPSARRASASSIPAVAVGAGPRALPDGRSLGARPERIFKVR